MIEKYAHANMDISVKTAMIAALTARSLDLFSSSSLIAAFSSICPTERYAIQFAKVNPVTIAPYRISPTGLDGSDAIRPVVYGTKDIKNNRTIMLQTVLPEIRSTSCHSRFQSVHVTARPKNDTANAIYDARSYHILAQESGDGFSSSNTRIVMMMAMIASENADSLSLVISFFIVFASPVFFLYYTG